MRHFKARRILILALSLLVVSALLTGIIAQQKRQRANSISTSQTSARPRPRLVLLIVVDQFRYDFLERFDDLFVAQGIKRLLRDGASWSEANYDHAPTYTAPGHASLMTGTWGSEHGIIANNWFERETGKRVSSVTDDATLLLGGREGEKGSSPRRLLASTLTDEMRLATNDRSKAIGISMKNRSAILPAGRHANAAYWFSTNTGNMVSSTYYFKSLPAWVERFNAGRMAEKFYGMRWDRLLSEDLYRKHAGADAPAWENIGTAKDTNTFPHIVKGGATSANSKTFYQALEYTPFTNDLLVAFAKQAITNESLGADMDTDFLSVSFSANDYVGHRFGPYSHEAMDVTLRVDRSIAALLDEVDARVGLENTLVVFTADHGVAPIPEHAEAINLPGRRIPAAEVVKAVTAAVKEHYGRKNTDDYIQNFKYNNEDRGGFINGNFYFNRAALKRDGINAEEFARHVGEAALRVPGTARYFTRGQLEGGAVSDSDVVMRRVLHGFHPARSGDVVIIYQPYGIEFSEPDDPADTPAAATHGSPYSYDTHVPLIIMGSGFKGGRYLEAATPADIAPTLAEMLGIQKPSNATGRVLIEGIKR